MSNFSVNNNTKRPKESLERIKQASEQLKTSGKSLDENSNIFKEENIKALKTMMGKTQDYSIDEYVYALSGGKLLDKDTKAEYKLFLNMLDADGNGKISSDEELDLNNMYSKDYALGEEDIKAFTEACKLGSQEDISNLLNDVSNILADDEININNKIDEKVEQQGTGDCYFLTTLNSMSKTSAGRQMIKNAISHDEENHTYTVTFPGVDKSYTFSASEIKEADEKNHVKKDDSGAVVGKGGGWYSEGDDDVLLMEMAYEQFRKDCADGKYDNEDWPDYVKDTGSYDGTDDNVSPLQSGRLGQVMYMFTGEGSEDVDEGTSGFLFWKHDNIDHALDQIQDKMDTNQMVVFASISGGKGYTEDSNGNYYKDDKGKFVEITAGVTVPADAQRYSFKGVGAIDSENHVTLQGVGSDEGQTMVITGNSDGGHALSITAITDDTVTIINPWDSEREITVSRKEFETYMYNVSSVDLGAKRHHGHGISLPRK